MRITIIGPGGVGGYFGAKLVQGGCDVRFIGRGNHLSAIKQEGLHVESGLGDIHLQNVEASDDPATFGVADIVLICVKLWGTEMAARAVNPSVGPNTAVISLQNGVQKEEVIRRILGDDAVVGGLCYIASKILRPGVIAHTGTMQRLIFGEFDGRASARTRAFLEACKSSGIDAEISSDIRRSIWEKFVFLVGVSAATTTMRSTLGPIRTNPQTRAFLLGVMREVVAVGRAHGIDLQPDFAENRLEFCDGLPAGMDSSMHNDLKQGDRLEVDWLSWAVVELGETVGIDTPLNRTVTAILALRALGQSNSGS